MFFLKKVIAIIENQKYRSAVEQLGDVLRRQGLAFEIGSAEETTDWETEISSLWLTDSASYANALQQLGQPVLAFLHADNRGQDFSGVSHACEEPQELDADYMDKVFRRYMRLPWDILQTERCFIRETVPEDAEAFYRIYSEPSITRYTEGLFPDIVQERQYINDYVDSMYGFYGFGVWTIIRNDTDEIIGRAGFSYREGYDTPEIGFVIGVPWQRQGYAEEVCRAILQYGREELGFTTIQAFVRPENLASRALCEKLGLEMVGLERIDDKEHYCLVRKL